METTDFHWGILGPGKIARQFAGDLGGLAGAKLVAVASRSPERATAFAREFGADYAVGGYENIFNGPRLDAVYVATPHTSHRELTELCLERGVAVLCEKPLGLNLAEVETMVATARRTGTYLMEALWTRFLPHVLAARELIDAGRIGRVESVRADFGFRADPDPTGRLWNPALGGGALLDIGIYPLFLAHFLLGPPEEIAAVAARRTPAGVDAEIHFTLRHTGDRLSHGYATLLGRTATEALVHGSRADLHLHSRFHEPSSFSILTGRDEPPENHYFQETTNGYAHEAAAVMADVRAGRRENARWSLDDSLALHRTLTAIRRRAGVAYPGEL